MLGTGFNKAVLPCGLQAKTTCHCLYVLNKAVNKAKQLVGIKMVSFKVSLNLGLLTLGQQATENGNL